MTSAPPVQQNNGKKAAVERYIGYHTSLTRQTHRQRAGTAFSSDIVFMIGAELPHMGLLFICSIQEHQYHSYNLLLCTFQPIRAGHSLFGKF
ncbi:hypothetical protein XELAEV_18046817mg [Xenopus laevis]|uniref:Uncharacterized protein n=1 Tax=Xenopus laevis TaxID=8355 RepID=A0A974BUI8_XENLA|nr:hypothetical protein XELAEV_18046817mg [Xenopus laevis]